MKRLFFSVALLASMVTSAVADELQITLDEAISIALSENPTIKIADLEVERYDYVRKTTLGSLLPQVSASGGYDQTLVSQDFAKGFSFGGDQYATLSMTGTVSLALYAPTVYRTLKMNATEAEAAVEDARSSRIELVAAVKSSFYGVLLAQRSLEVLEQSSVTSKQTVDETEMKYNNGLAAEYDLLTAQVQYNNLQPTILQTRSSVSIAKDLLKMYLSIPRDVEIEVIGELSQMQEEAILSTHNLSRDLSQNTTLRSLALTQDLLTHQLRINNSTRLPTLGAYGQVSYTGNNMESISWESLMGGTTTTTEADRSFFWQNPVYVGLSLSIPIFSGMTTSSRSRQIENQMKQMELQRTYTEQSLDVSLSTAISNIYTARETLYAQQQTVEQATKAYNISVTRYNAGAGTMLELNSAQLSLTQAELNLSQAIYDILTAKSEYDRIIGVE